MHNSVRLSSVFCVSIGPFQATGRRPFNRGCFLPGGVAVTLSRELAAEKCRHRGSAKWLELAWFLLLQVSCQEGVPPPFLQLVEMHVGYRPTANEI